MPRLIDADKLRKDVLDLPNCYNGFSDTYDKAMIIDLIDEQPTVGVVFDCSPLEEVKHGHWVENNGRYGWYCSHCKKENNYAYDYNENNVIELQDHYCPHCGAKMDEGEKDAGKVQNP